MNWSPSYKHWAVFALEPSFVERVRNTVLGWFK